MRDLLNRLNNPGAHFHGGNNNHSHVQQRPNRALISEENRISYDGSSSADDHAQFDDEPGPSAGYEQRHHRGVAGDLLRRIPSQQPADFAFQNSQSMFLCLYLELKIVSGVEIRINSLFSRGRWGFI